MPGCGVSNTAALVCRWRGSWSRHANTESWNGSAWTEAADLNTTRRLMGGNGTSTSALTYGGNAPPGRQTATESWNGSAWTEVNNLNTARHSLAGIGTDNTSALAFGGDQPSTNYQQLTKIGTVCLGLKLQIYQQVDEVGKACQEQPPQV